MGFGGFDFGCRSYELGVLVCCALGFGCMVYGGSDLMNGLCCCDGLIIGLRFCCS